MGRNLPSIVFAHLKRSELAATLVVTSVVLLSDYLLHSTSIGKQAQTTVNAPVGECNEWKMKRIASLSWFGLVSTIIAFHISGLSNKATGSSGSGSGNRNVMKKIGFVKIFEPTPGSLGEIWDRYTNSEGVKYVTK